jgi:D-beta-D-heptose 7-phosphate kinase/D-beta-D-heptose 1-phosphate adenosyltransferase
MKTIFTNGCFDILHRGHIELLEFAKSLGNHLIVGLNSDASVKKIKGEHRPINCQDDRKKVLKSIKFVDKVIVFNEETPYELIKIVKPDIIVKGGDYYKDQVIGSDLCEVRIFKYLDGYSTSKIIQGIGNR